MKQYYFFLLLLCSNLSWGQLPEQHAVDQIFKAWDSSDSPGCALGVMKDGKLIYAKGYGMANLEYPIPNSAFSVFRIGSTSKQFTAACIILLAQNGKLELTQTLDHFFPDFPDYAKQITVKHLLNHTSGIRDYLTLSYLRGLGNDDYYTDSDIMSWLINQQDLNFAPGEEFLYSNSGYWLLGQIVNKVSGQNMADYAKEAIFKPLDMTETHFHNNHNQIVNNRASGYRPTKENGYEISMTTLDMIGDGGIFTTINDIKKWDDSYYNSSVLNKAFWEQMCEQGRLNDGTVLDYASGLGIGSHKGLKTISHGGAFVGFRAELIRFPEQHFSVAIFANRADSNPSQMALQVADVFLKSEFKSDENTTNPANQSATAAVNFIDLSTTELEQYCGHYWNPENLLARKIYLRDGMLRYFRSETNESDLKPFGKNAFKMVNVGGDVTVSFQKQPDGRYNMLFRVNDDPDSVSIPFTPKDYNPSELKAFAGDYHSSELNVVYSIKLEANQLMLYVNQKKISPLKTVLTNVFSNTDFGTFQFNTDHMGQPTSFTLAAGRVKNLKFKKQ
ncbi:MAG: hypothetical protein BM564_01675 [Bacteroidetes bacterium MedPE-SWsnd-G2]|nr:MAG: hypothetical protein BM564_01675 [Bacteroidetes bacterium MedPE-SWsnd-G2]